MVRAQEEALIKKNFELLNAKVTELHIGNNIGVLYNGQTMVEHNLNQLTNDLLSEYKSNQIVPNIESDFSADKLSGIISDLRLAIYQYDSEKYKWIKYLVL